MKQWIDSHERESEFRRSHQEINPADVLEKHWMEVMEQCAKDYGNEAVTETEVLGFYGIFKTFTVIK